MSSVSSGSDPAFAHALGLADTLVRELARARALDRDFDRVLDRALALHDCLKEAARPMYAISSVDEGDPVRVTASADWLVRVEMRLLPPRYRARYIEEFQAELHALATAKATRSMQVLYALQQLCRVWQLRAALQAPDRPRFHRVHRAACWVLASEWRTWGILIPH